MTAAAIEALNAAGMHNTKAQRKAFEYLHLKPRTLMVASLSTRGKAEPNVASSAWAVQAIWSAGQNPETWQEERGRGTAFGYMESMQREDGSIH